MRHRGTRLRGFTVTELLMVLILVGILSVAALPRMSLLNATSPLAARDQVVAALRLAHKHAASHRRLVCAAIAPQALTLTIAAANPASSCTGALLRGPDGTTNQLSVSRGLVLSSLPAATLHFQPSGQVSSDAAGTNVVNFSIGVSVGSEAAATITVVGQTGAIQ